MWQYDVLDLELKVTWAISRSQSDIKKNFLLKYTDQDKTYFAEIAPNTRYGEEFETVRAQLDKYLPMLETKQQWDSFDKTKLFPSISFGVDQIFFQLEGQKLLHFNKNLKTSFSIPIMDRSKLSTYLDNAGEFDFYKIKVASNEQLPFVEEIFKLRPNAKLCIDANEGFESALDFIAFTKHLDLSRVEFFEQPLPSSHSEHEVIKDALSVPIIADESCHGNFSMEKIAKEFDGVNIKLMKCFSIMQAQDLLESAKSLGLKCMLGCMIETSLSLQYAFQFSNILDYVDLDGFLLIKDDPFQKIKHLGRGRLELSS